MGIHVKQSSLSNSPVMTVMTEQTLVVAWLEAEAVRDSQMHLHAQPEEIRMRPQMPHLVLIKTLLLC